MCHTSEVWHICLQAFLYALPVLTEAIRKIFFKRDKYIYI